jgi:SMC interacting uncharacterized protein involved in chromosome segregation
MFIRLKKHKEIIKNFEVNLKADLIAKEAKDELIKRLLEEIVKKEQEIKELQQKIEKLEVK